MFYVKPKSPDVDIEDHEWDGWARSVGDPDVSMPRVAGRRMASGVIEPSSFSRAYSTSDFHDSAVRSSSRTRGNRGCGRTVLNPTAVKKSTGARHEDSSSISSPNLASP